MRREARGQAQFGVAARNIQHVARLHACLPCVPVIECYCCARGNADASDLVHGRSILIAPPLTNTRVG
jgi:hypothetical protein